MTAPVAAAASERRSLPTPPMASLGSIAEFLATPLAVFRRGYAEHGPVFGVQLGPMPGVVLAGPEYHEFFFRQVDHGLSLGDLYRFVVPMFGEVLLAVPDRDERRRQVSLMHSAFERDRLADYEGAIAAEVDQWLDRCGDAGSFDVWDAMEEVTMNVSARTLLGPEVREAIAEYRPLLDDLARGMDFILPPDLPLEKFRRRDRAREQLIERIGPIIAGRRRNGARHSDFLQKLVDSAEGGEVIRDTETLTGIALCTLFTGYLTTAAQMSWALVLLAEHRDYLDELTKAMAEDPRRSAALLGWALQEAQRLRPVMSHYARKTVVPYVAGGYHVPHSWLTILCPAVSHRLAHVFADPDRYDPLRFSPGREEDKRQPHSLIGFGGGFYRCPGSAFGTLEMRTLIGRLLDRFSISLETPEPAVSFDVGVMRPASPCTIRYVRRDSPLRSDASNP